MKLAFLDSWLQSRAEGSGTAVAISGLQQALVQRGLQIARIAPTFAYPRSLTLRRLRFNAQLPWQLRATDYDCIIGFDFDGFLCAARLPRPYFVSIKGVLAEESLQETGRFRWLLGGLSHLEGYNARRAQGVFTTSAYCRRKVHQHYGVPLERIHIVPEGIDLPRWQAMLAATPRQSDGGTILCVARQYRRKRVADLIRAMPLVRQALPTARAVIVGDGPEHGQLRGLVAALDVGGFVELRGAIADEHELARCYRQADVFCLPSVQEGFGIVYLEAMASGLPIVATTATAIPEVVPAGQAGLLIAPGNVPQLAEALLTLLRDRAQRARMAAFGERQVVQYDWPCVAQRFLEVLATVL